MYRSVRELRGTTVLATDGKVGYEEQVFFDDERWVIRYLVVDTEGPAGERAVLVSPFAVRTLGPDAIEVDLSTRQVAESPDVDTERPVSRQKEIEYSRYFNYPIYWGDVGLWHHHAAPAALLRAAPEDPGMPLPSAVDMHLRSSREVIGYRVRARDGRIGHVEDFLFDDVSWAIAYVEMDTRNIVRGKRVLVSPARFTDVKWGERRVHVDLPVAALRDAPEYQGIEGLTPDFRNDLERHYARF